jgi:hypothetical protein
MDEKVFTESPASWNTRYIDPSGFECQLTLRAETGADLLKKAGAALKALVDAGCTPSTHYHPAGNGSKPAEAPKMPDGSPDPTWCVEHGVAMRRHEKDGQVWYSHKVGEGDCRGAAKK